MTGSRNRSLLQKFALSAVVLLLLGGIGTARADEAAPPGDAKDAATEQDAKPADRSRPDQGPAPAGDPAAGVDEARLAALQARLSPTSPMAAAEGVQPRTIPGEPCARATFSDNSFDVGTMDVVVFGYDYYCSDEEFYFGFQTRDPFIADTDLYEFWLDFDADRNPSTGCQDSYAPGAELAGYWDYDSVDGDWSWGDWGRQDRNCGFTPTSRYPVFHPQGGSFLGAVLTKAQIGTSAFRYKALIESWNDGPDVVPDAGFANGSRPVGNVYFVADSFVSAADRVIVYGRPDDATISGDWSGDGFDTLGVRRGNMYYLNNSLAGGNADITVGFGRATDETFVGDWDGDGTDSIGLRRGNTFFLNNKFAGGEAEISFAYGRPSDQVYVGDWDGNGTDTFALRRGNTFYISNTFAGGNATLSFAYGRPGDQVLVGDWDGDGDDTLGVRRGNTLYLNNALLGGNADTVLAYGRASDRIYIGDWNGDRISTPIVRR